MASSRFALVVGVGPGLGLSVAKRFAREGFKVGLVARSADKLAAFAATIEGGSAIVATTDVADTRALQATMAEIVEEHGTPEVFVYNVGGWYESKALELPVDQFRRELDMCVGGALVCTQVLVPRMTAAGGGSLLYTGGGLALSPHHGATVPGLVAGKSALRGLVLAMATELRSHGLKPGMITVAGQIKPGTPLDPELIAEAYWDFHTRPADDTVEVVFTG